MPRGDAVKAMTNRRPEDEPDPHEVRSAGDDLFTELFADLPAFDVIDGELMPRPRRARR